MKTLSIKRISNILAILFFTLIFPISLSAQAPSCNYTVSNPGMCTVSVTVQYYDSGNNPCGTYGQPIVSASSYVFSCSSCSQPLTNVVVTLVLVARNVLTGSSIGIVDINSITDSGGITGTGCNGQTSYNMSWNVNETVVMY